MIVAASPEGYLAIFAGIAAAITAAALILQFLGSRRQKAEFVTERADSARSEAQSLAITRGELIDDLRDQLRRETELRARETERTDKAIDRLERELESSRRDAADTQRLLVIGFTGILEKLQAHLVADPPEVAAAVALVRDMLSRGDGRDGSHPFVRRA